MNNLANPLSEADIVAARPPKNRVDPWRPYGYFAERERAAGGKVVDVSTLLLTNRECSLRCLMCDLWKNTTDETVPRGAIPAQIAYALARLPPARHLKLYNSGSFFDRKAIPPGDWPAIAELARPFENVIVENHPQLCTDECLRFRDLLGTNLEIALGLETVHPEVLVTLHKRMTIADFDRAAHFLNGAGIAVRVFLLLRPPPLGEQEGIDWAVRSIEHAFAAGAAVCSIIPTRAGNGIMQRLAHSGQFSPPRLGSLERVLERGLALGQGRVLVDLWDAGGLAACPRCRWARIERLAQMNLSQSLLPSVTCECLTDS
ncbi:MAG: radical SAM protein [Pirellulaceae bacterium]